MAKSKHKRTPKTVLKLPDLEQSKSAVMNSLTSASSKRSYDHPTRVCRILLRQDEGRFAEIEFAGNLLHALGRNAAGVRQNRELITAERCRTENIDDVKCVL